MAATYLEVHLAQPPQFWEATVAQDGPAAAQGPPQPAALCQALGPTLIVVEGAHVPSSRGDEIELVACSLSPSL